MAKCKCCKLEMIESDGCLIEKVSIAGKEYDRIKVGDDMDFYQGNEDEELRCHDCGAKLGHYHHYGCDAERCPSCYEQLIGCECEDMTFEELES